MKNILRENMRRFNTKNLNEQMSMAEPWRSKFEIYRDSILALLNLPLKYPMDQRHKSQNLDKIKEINSLMDGALNNMNIATMKALYKATGYNSFKAMLARIRQAKIMKREDENNLDWASIKLQKAGDGLLKHLGAELASDASNTDVTDAARVEVEDRDLTDQNVIENFVTAYEIFNNAMHSSIKK